MSTAPTFAATTASTNDPEALGGRRFTGVSRLYGELAFARIRAAHVVIAGVGGVGSWAAESLARSGVGRLTLIDLDVVAESNLNRQAHATVANLGRNKIDAMRERILSFAPDCAVHVIDDFVSPDNVAVILPADASYVIDAVDKVRAKIALVLHCLKFAIPLVVCGGAGGKTDPTLIRRTDLTQTKNDALLAKLRVNLRQNHGFPRGTKKFHIAAVFSEEQQQGESAADGESGLACAGYGSAMHMTAALGLAAAGAALDAIVVQTSSNAETD
jgi:tRNA threonylcarbamoyladenosine dehydratase